MRTLAMFIVNSMLLHVLHATTKQGYVSEFFNDKKSMCANKRIYSLNSEIQCVHRCLRSEGCGVLNYKGEDDEKSISNNCEVFDVPSDHGSCSSVKDVGWKSVIFKRLVGPKPKVYKSCKEISLNVPDAKSGVYELEDGKHFCRMGDVTGCGAGGWTLAMKVNGSKPTFVANSEFWNNSATFNVANGIKSFYDEEAKFNAFSRVSFDAVCLGIRLSATTKWLRIKISRSSLQDIFRAGAYNQSSIPRATWKNLIANSSLQLNCNHQGFNVQNNDGRIFARIGYVGNQENDCASPDSFIGIGTTGDLPCNPLLPNISCGNFASCYPDNGDKSIPTFGFILIH